MPDPLQDLLLLAARFPAPAAGLVSALAFVPAADCLFPPSFGCCSLPAAAQSADCCFV